jgi:hypothetical protein
VTATLPRPGDAVQLSNSPFPSTPASLTGPWFVVGLSEKGPLRAVPIESLAQFVSTFGERVTYGLLYDVLDEYFSEGGSLAYVGRVVGPAAASATAVLKDASTGESLKVTASGPGAWGNEIKVKVTNNTTTFKLEVLLNNVLVEVSPELSSQAAAVSWAVNSFYIEIAIGTSTELPKTQEPTLANGKDDRNNIGDTNWKAALQLFGRNLGPGQVSQAGRNTNQAYKDTLEHGLIFNRFALLDPPQSASVATVTSAATALRGTNDIYGAMFAPWITIPGVLPNTTRTVPPSALVAAKISQSDGEGNSPNKAAANLLGKSIRAIGLEVAQFENAAKEGFDITRDEMYSKGVNLIIFEEGSYMVYGWRALVDPNGALQDWLDAGNCRLRMAIVAKGNIIAKKFVLDEIDAAGVTFGEFEGELNAMLTDYWKKGSLYGKTAEEAFQVDTGPSINTPATIRNKEMKAAIALRMSENSEMVVIIISKVPVTQNLPV